MMPLASVLMGLGKITSPLLCEIQVEIFGIGLIFYTLIVVSGILMFGVIILNKHLRGVKWNDTKIIVEETNALKVLSK